MVEQSHSSEVDQQPEGDPGGTTQGGTPDDKATTPSDTTEDTSTGGEPSEDTGGESSAEPMPSISREEFQRAQKEDANLRHMWHEAVNNEGDYCVRHGLLVRRWKSRNLEERPLEGEPESLSLVVPARYKEEVLKRGHDCTGHFGAKKTRKIVAEHFYWAGLA